MAKDDGLDEINARLRREGIEPLRIRSKAKQGKEGKEGTMPRKQARKKRASKARSSKEYSFVDAKKPFTLHITMEDIKGAVPGDSRNCVLSRAGRREHNCFDIMVHRNVAYVRKNERSVPVRYQVTESAKDLLVAFDASGRSHPITLTFVPPRKALSSAYLRSPERRARDKASKTRVKIRQQAIGPTGKRRMYTRPDPLTLFGVRNGSGVRPLGSGRLR
jgi:hypothetical protein